MHIYPEDQVDENFFDIYYHPFKKQIWGAGAIFAAVVISFLWYREHRTSRLNEQWARYEDSVLVRDVILPGQANAELVEKQIAGLRQLARDYPDDAVTPFALKGIVDAQVAAGAYSDALQSLDELQSRFPDFSMFTTPASSEDGSKSLADHLRGCIESEAQWTQSTSYEHRWPSDERVACVDTTMGTFWLGFYAEEAPRHVEAFIETAKAGAYNGTQFYEVRRGTDGAPQVVRAGSSFSKTERDPARHDRDDPADTIEPEDSRFTIRHLFRVVSSVEMPSGESRSRFQVVTAAGGMEERYHGRNTPFAAVLDRGDSIATIDRIARAQTYETNPETASADGTFRMRDHPYPAITIRRVTILTNEAPEDGHSFDTSLFGKDEPEAWEADLPAAPKPEEFTQPKAPAPGAGDAVEPGEDDDDDETPDDTPVDEAGVTDDPTKDDGTKPDDE